MFARPDIIRALFWRLGQSIFIAEFVVKFKMSENSLFALLLRSSAWLSFAIGGVGALLAHFFLPDQYATYAWSLAIPFCITGLMVVWKQWHLPSAARVSATLEAVAAMSWREFSGLMEQAFKRDGHSVTRTNGAADFILMKGGRTVLVSCKRWKAASHGLQPLRELDAERKASEANETLYVAPTGMTDNALRFAAERKIGLMQGPQLTTLLRLPGKH